METRCTRLGEMESRHEEPKNISDCGRFGLAGASASFGSIDLVGDIIEGNSFAQTFRETCTTAFSEVKVHWQGSSQAVYFETSPGIVFATGSNWSQSSATSTLLVADGPLNTNGQPITTDFDFTIWFTGHSTMPVQFYVEVGNLEKSGAFDRVDATGLSWNGSSWTIGTDYNPPGTPQPIPSLLPSSSGRCWGPEAGWA